MSAVGSLVKRMFALDGARSGYVLEDTAAGATPGLHPGNKLMWTGAPTITGSGGIGGIGYASNSGTVEAAQQFSAAPLGASPRTVVAAFRTLDVDGVVLSFGVDGTNTDDAFAVDSASAATWVHTGNTAPIAAAVADGNWHVVAMRAAADGAYRVDVDGVRVGDGVFPAGPLATGTGPLRVFRHPSGSAPRHLVGDIAFVAVWGHELTDVELGRYSGLLLAPHKLSGIAALDDATPATAVMVRRVGDREHLLTVIPASPTGAWEALVPAGDYEITCVGPDGFQPQVFSPVSAVPV